MALLEGDRIDNWIGGHRVAPQNGRYLASVDPSFARAWVEVPDGDAADVDLAVDAARRAFASAWRPLPAMARAGFLRAVAQRVAEHADELATIECRDNGKPIAKSQAIDAGVAARLAYNFAGWPTKIAGQTPSVSAPCQISSGVNP